MSNENSVNVTVTLSVDELNIVLGALGEVPAKLSMNVIGKITSQAQQQLQAQQTVPAEALNG